MTFVLRLVHILAGAFWFGALMFVARFLMPSLKAVGPAAGPVMNQLSQVRKMPLAMMAAAILTILSGAWLMSIDSAGTAGAWMRTGPGRTFALGGVVAILAAVFGMAVNSPAGRRIGIVSAAVAKRGGPPTAEEAAELQRLQQRLATGTQVAAVLVFLATAAMAVARYVP